MALCRKDEVQIMYWIIQKKSLLTKMILLCYEISLQPKKKSVYDFLMETTKAVVLVM